MHRAAALSEEASGAESTANVSESSRASARMASLLFAASRRAVALPSAMAPSVRIQRSSVERFSTVSSASQSADQDDSGRVSTPRWTCTLEAT